METFKKYYVGSAIFTALAVALCYAFGGANAAFLCMMLGIMEVSLSLDNAVVNAGVLEPMDAVWRKRFLTWGMLISVLFVRLLFPILIVWSTSTLSLVQSATIPFENASLYATMVQSAHIKIAGFGGTFLLMVFLAFMLDQEKENHWIPGLEKMLNKLGSFGSPIGMAVTLSCVISWIVEDFVIKGNTNQYEFGFACIAGNIAWLVVHYLGEKLNNNSAEKVVAAGLGAFIYLNVLDASFSFDGVIGAFALTNEILLIAAGLGIGSLFVRSMTIHMVDKGTLGELMYLEHGAFWSIGVLTGLMFASTVIDIPEIVSGLSAAVILGVALIHSLKVKQQPEVQATA